MRRDVNEGWMVVAHGPGAVCVLQLGEVLAVNAMRWRKGEGGEYWPLAGPFRHCQTARQKRRELKDEGKKEPRMDADGRGMERGVGDADQRGAVSAMDSGLCGEDPATEVYEGEYGGDPGPAGGTDAPGNAGDCGRAAERGGDDTGVKGGSVTTS